MGKLISLTYGLVTALRASLKRRLPRGSLLFRTLRPFSQIIEKLFPAYRRLSGDSIFYREGELGMSSLSCPRLLDEVIEMFRPKSVLDIGCGTGVSMDYLIERGVSVVGIEGSELAISRARHPEKIIRHNLNRETDLGRKFDVVWSYEVVEHIMPKYVENLVSTFSNHGDLIVMSAAPPGQGGEGHFNEQPPSYWVEKFEGRGFRLDSEATERLRATGDPFCENMLVFRR